MNLRSPAWLRLPRLSGSRHRRRRFAPLTRWVSVAAVAAVLGSSVVVGMSASAGSAQTVFLMDDFTGNAYTQGLYAKPGAVDNVNMACLTASTNAGAQIPGCGAASGRDPVGSGALRLTDTSQKQVGGVGVTQSIPISKGLDTAFETYQYGGTSRGADGIGFYLAATDPYNPKVPSVIGQLGGSLGYGMFSTNPGLAYGYLGVGLDAFGNFKSRAPAGADCKETGATNDFVPDITVRGPGNGTAGYCMVTSKTVSTTDLRSTGTTRSAAAVPVEFAINPSSAPVMTVGTAKLSPVSIPARSYIVVYKTIGATAQSTMTGALPSLTGNTAGFPSSWYDPATGLPYKLTFGWVGSTGANTDKHEVGGIRAQTISGLVPGIVASAAVDDATPEFGSTGTYTVNAGLSADGGSETAPMQTTTTFPAGLTPAVPASVNGWACSTATQTVSCTYSGAVDAGSSYPKLALPFTASGAVDGSTLAIASTVSSTDATAVSTGASATITRASTAASITIDPASQAAGSPVTATATVAPTSATGSVTFTDPDSGTVICDSVPLKDSTASCSTSAFHAGSHAITATYSGDANHLTSTVRGAVTVTARQAGLTVTAAPAGVVYGQKSTLTASGLDSRADGTVAFLAKDGTTLCSSPVANGAASCSTGILEPGTHALTATYSGGVDDAPASSTNEASITVSRAVLQPTTTLNGAGSATVAYGTPVTVAVKGLGDATGTVRFVDNHGDAVCSITLPTTSCVSDGTRVAGQYTVSAEYAGDAHHEPATSAGAALAVAQQGAAPLTVTVNGDSATSIAYGSPVTIAGLGTPDGATGTVTFRDGTTVLCEATLPSTSCDAPSTLEVGSHAVSAEYSGDANHSASLSTTAATITVNRISSKPTITINGSGTGTVMYGGAATLAVADLASGSSGPVEFRAGDAALCRVDDVASTTECRTSTTLGAGTYQVRAEYAGDAHHAPATTATATLRVTQQTSPQLTVTVNGLRKSSTVYGTAATVAVSGVPAGAGGTVTFSDTAGKLCSVDVLQGSSCATPAETEVGSHDVVAEYSGDSNHLGAVSATPATLEVVRIPSDLVVTIGGERAGSVEYGSTATLAVSGLPKSATGTVTFRAGDTVLCTVDDPSSTCKTPADLAAGGYQVIASYAGDAHHADSTSPAAALVVTKQGAHQTVALVNDAAASSITFGETAKLSVTGLPDGASGRVVFKDATGVLCTVSDVSAATSCMTQSKLPVGAYTVTAEYSGDRNHQGSTSTPAALTVERAAIPVVTTVNGQPEATVSYGDLAELSVEGLPSDATGSVAFVDASGVELAECTVTALPCDTPSDMPAGKHLITGTYSGDENYTSATPEDAPAASRTAARASSIVRLASDESPAAQTVSHRETVVLTIAAIPTAIVMDEPAKVRTGEQVRLSAHGLPAAATGTVTFTTDDGVDLCSTDLPELSCSARVDLEPGTYSVHARYSGDENRAASESDPVALVVIAVPTAAPTASPTPKVTASATAAPAPAPELAFTGAAAWLLPAGIAALVAIALGAAALRSRRRPR